MPKVVVKDAQLFINGKPVAIEAFGPLPPAGWTSWPARFDIPAYRDFGGRMVDAEELRADESILNSLGITGRREGDGA